MYNKKKIKNKIIRRVVLLGSFKLLIFSCIIGRLYKLQVIDSKKYKILSNNNRVNLVLQVPTRGKILDSTGNIIADNRTIYTLTVTPFLISNISLSIKNIKNLIDISLDEINLFYSKLKGLEKNHHQSLQ
jgi:penicillin-binding protein 2